MPSVSRSWSLLLLALFIALVAVLDPLKFFTGNKLKPDVSAILLNWTRFPNVQQIVRTICEDLDDIVINVVVWNNNPNLTVSAHVSSALS